MNDDCKYVLTWFVPSIILILGLMICCCVWNYSITSKFIDAGFHQEQIIGNYGFIWKK